MSQADFLRNVRLPNLGFGAATVMWGFRACALGHTQCGCLVGGFERIFGTEQGEVVLRRMLGMARIFGNEGGRRVTIARPGSLGVTPDEGALLGALNAAQSDEIESRDAYLGFLFAKNITPQLQGLASDLADAYLRRGLMIGAPENIPTPAPNSVAGAVVDLASVRAMGRA